MTAVSALDWVEYIENNVGFVLPNTQHGWLINAVDKVASELGMSVQELYNNLHHQDVRQKVIDAVLIPETRFFRNPAVMDFVANCYEKHLHKDDDTPFLVASIGCSTGQEVWSLAMVLEYKRRAYATFYNKVPAPYELIGVDASTTSLALAKQAVYPERVQREIPKTHHHNWQKHDKLWQVNQKLKDTAQFIHCNVFSPDDFWEKLGQYAGKLSLVLSQNMLIYFRRYDQMDILDRLSELIKAQGYLVLGAGEGWFWHSQAMTPLGNSQVHAWHKSPKPAVHLSFDRCNW